MLFSLIWEIREEPPNEDSNEVDSILIDTQSVIVRTPSRRLIEQRPKTLSPPSPTPSLHSTEGLIRSVQDLATRSQNPPKV